MRPIRARNPLPQVGQEVGRRCAVGAGGFGLACCTFLLSFKGTALLCCVASFDDEMVPGGSVRGE